MPMIEIKMFEGRTAEQKRELAEALTRETCRVLKCEPGAVDIIIHDIAKASWATGGTFWSDRK